jgi:7-cyano-7-deazaguanine reductase
MSVALGRHPRPVPAAGTAPWLGADLWWCPPRVWSGPQALWLTLPVDGPWALEPAHAPALLAGDWAAQAGDSDALRAGLRSHLHTLLWAGGPARSSAGVRLSPPEQAPAAVPRPESPDACVDRLDVDAPTVPASADMLQAAWDEKPVSEHLFTERLCMPDGQGGWVRARLALDYSGPQIAPGSLMAYALAWRHRPVAMPLWADALASDIAQRCRPSRLSLQLHLASADGGLAVSSWRTKHPQQPPAWARWCPA